MFSLFFDLFNLSNKFKLIQFHYNVSYEFSFYVKMDTFSRINNLLKESDNLASAPTTFLKILPGQSLLNDP